ncbi:MULTISPECIES: hypothetical protein [Rhizobium]|uniref:Uncharacterized protein n=1 Tax=Rhizobium tropici TaxID=398 RepID=A0A6P1CH36_RHITR|nr:MULTISPECIES: hypothetical protein [Rhizobium]AGB71726.1 hypothetical protein RTCIAT899_CH11725 [Rhizobium tropici CIAT 899]MBB4239914.1 hypothetical protein [Rhizobium tropici]MBB5591184.1 hypothetical protein [Rhizobium tropici]MBB6490732.1 hypothetical protein [Rhizobium tropici]NEV15093.1 hypothetical protein [Rhizobium tropici]
MASSVAHYILFAADGRIRQSGHCDRETLPELATLFDEGYAVMEVPAAEYRLDIDATSYVRDGAIVPKRPAIEITEYTIRADGIEKVCFAVPAGTSVVHANEIVAIDDGIFEFTTDVRGDHRLPFIAAAGFHDFEVTIHAV